MDLLRQFAKASGMEVEEQDGSIFDKVKDAFKADKKKKWTDFFK